MQRGIVPLRTHPKPVFAGPDIYFSLITRFPLFIIHIEVRHYER
jgi:hypothetical protein